MHAQPKRDDNFWRRKHTIPLLNFLTRVARTEGTEFNIHRVVNFTVSNVVNESLALVNKYVNCSTAFHTEMPLFRCRIAHGRAV